MVTYFMKYFLNTLQCLYFILGTTQKRCTGIALPPIAEIPNIPHEAIQALTLKLRSKGNDFAMVEKYTDALKVKLEMKNMENILINLFL